MGKKLLYTFSLDILVALHETQLLHMPNAHTLPFAKRRPTYPKDCQTAHYITQ